MVQHTSGTRTRTRRGARSEREGLWDWNLLSNRVHFSPGWIALIGSHDHEIGNTPDEWFQRVHPDDSDQLLGDIAAARADGERDFDLRYRLRHKDGTYRWMVCRGLVVRNEAGEAIRLTGSQSDVTVETVTDPLTGLPNRLLLVERLTQSVARAQRHSTFHFALLLIDLGRAAGASRTTPRPAGDPLLSAAARRLETSLRSPDITPGVRQTDLVARVDGDRLAVLLDGLYDLSHAKVIADHLLVEMLQPFSLNGCESHLTPTIGIAVSATAYTRADDALRDAETALHRAQVLGGSHSALFDTHTMTAEQTDLQFEAEFESALERREFDLVYQPIVSIGSRQIVGFEALVRWQHPVLGLVAPLDFISIAERTGFIVPLGHWILQEACLRLRAWQTSVPVSEDMWMSVNLSGVQLRQPDLVEQIEQTLHEAGLQGRHLALELTEGIAMENPDAVTTLFMRLRAMGVRISIDDFGTGYSSLAYLRQFPVDTLKIDRSFIQGVERDSDREAIVASTMAMAQRLGLHVIAEGVETSEQVNILRSLQCDCVQGYLFAEPLPSDAAADLLKNGLPPFEHERGGAAAPPSTLAAAGFRRWPIARGRLLMVAAGVAVLVAAAVVALDDSHAALPPPAAPVHDVQRSTPVTPAPDGLDAALAAVPPLDSPRNAERPSGTLDEKGLVAGPPAAPAAAPLRPQITQRTFDVVHLHRIGNCRGRLIVSSRGVTFEEAGGEPQKDAFVLSHAEFVHSREGDTLIVKSAERTYRFRTGGTSAQGSDESRMHELENALARSRAE